MKQLLNKLFGKTGKQSHLHIDHPDGIAISQDEVKRLEAQFQQEVASLAPLQQRLKEETGLLKDVIENKLSPSQRMEVRALLRGGEDPMLLAAFLRVPFRDVAIIANDVLKEVHGHEAPQIPTDVQAYIKLAQGTKQG